MNEPLSILLPVHNAARTLARDVAAIIEVAAELTGQFEIAIIDDGSTDVTEEIACDLSRCFPQVTLARHHRRRGIDASIATGMAATSGAIVMILPQDEPLQPAEMRRLWRIGKGDDPSDARAADRESAASEHSTAAARLFKWGRRLREDQAERGDGLRMIRRQRYEKRHPTQRCSPGRFDGEATRLAAAPNFLARVRELAFSE